MRPRGIGNGNDGRRKLDQIREEAMKHYETERWVDFARGLSGDAERAAMQAHLAAGCRQCGRRAELLGELAAMAHADLEYEPPADVMRMARSIFQAPHPAEEPSTARILATLIYNSVRDPLPAGMRTSDRPSQVLYEAEDYMLDLHVNKERTSRESGAPRMVLVGQIASRKDPGRPLAELPVVLKAGRKVAARGVANSLGEFHLEFVPTAGLRLEIPVESGRTIEVELPQES
jgi:hypothetical protein